jgi:serine/threonine protein kinase
MTTNPSRVTPLFTAFGGARYRLLECIGRGATGGVYRARAESAFGEAREVCIKRLSGHMTPEAAREMREEARLLARVRHANVVSLLEMGHEPTGAPFLVLELIDGCNLRSFTRVLGRKSIANDEPTSVNAGWLPDRVAVYVACAVLRAIAAVQRAIPGLVHRDVTPHNVLLSREGEVKLTDFGIALALDRARWTRPSVVKGKLGYMAPEQIRGEPLDVRCDLFAVGVVLFELLARRRPWFGANGDFDELRAIEQGEIASVTECRPRIDRVLGAAVDRLLAWDRTDRFDSADAALRALGPFSAGDLGSLRLASILEPLLPPRRVAAPPSRGSSPDTASVASVECDPNAHAAARDGVENDPDPTVVEGRAARLANAPGASLDGPGTAKG